MIFFPRLSLPSILVASLVPYAGRWMGLRQFGRGLLTPADLTLVDLLILALGIGVITTVFGTVYTVFLRPPGGGEGFVSSSDIHGKTHDS